MLIIPVKEGENIDRALKRYKRKFDRTKTMKNLRNRKNFTKPSVAKRAQKIKASYVQRLRTQEEVGTYTPNPKNGSKLAMQPFSHKI